MPFVDTALPIDTVLEEQPITTPSEPEQIFQFMVNLLEGGFQPGPSFIEKAYEFAYELANKALIEEYPPRNRDFLRLAIMLQASVFMKQAYFLLAADSQRRADEQQMTQRQQQGPRIARLND